MTDGEASAVRPLAVEVLGERFRRYRLSDPAAEEAMARSLQRYGQIAPVVVWVLSNTYTCGSAVPELLAELLRWVNPVGAVVTLFDAPETTST